MTRDHLLNLSLRQNAEAGLWHSETRRIPLFGRKPGLLQLFRIGKLTIIWQLPLPCVLNSRYLDFDRMERVMRAIGFTLQKEQWKKEGKMVYWLFQKGSKPLGSDEALQRKVVIRQGNRNNFSILL